MKKRSVFYSTVVGVLASGIVFQFGLAGGDTYAQKADSSASLITKTAKVSGPSASSLNANPVASSSAFAGAAAQNARLRTALQWTFGGKTQNGWALYSSLIGRTINTEAAPASAEFAAALAEWQKKAGIAPTGVLEKTTLEAFVKFWQSQRLGRSVYPGDDKLISAPSLDFWDSSREEGLRRLERSTYEAYKKMVAAAARDLGKDIKFTPAGDLAEGEKFLRIVSAYRSREYQEQLRKQQPGAGRAALAKHSPHYTGQALDLYVGGEPVTTKDANRAIQVETPAYKWLVKNAHKFGFRPYFYEPWHWEFVGEDAAK